VIDELNEDLRAEFDQISGKRSQYDTDLAEAEKNGGVKPDKEGVELRSAEELGEALSELQARLELVVATNPGVVEQYENRKVAVSDRRSLSVSRIG
jgi:structural maintenance of chromosomes protein 5